MISILKKSFFSSSIFCLMTTAAFAGGFTTDKNVYDFALEYQGVFSDNKAGKSNGNYTHDIEIDNEFGITDNQSVGLDIFLTRNATFADENNQIEKSNSAWIQSFNVRHGVSLTKIGNFDFGLENGLGINDDNDGADGNYNIRWELRLKAKHSSSSGFYKQARFDVRYFRNFSANTADRLRFDFRTKFRLADKVDLFARVNTYYNMTNASTISARDQAGVDTSGLNAYYFKGKAPQMTFSILNVGPEFSIGSNASVYVYYVMTIDGANAEFRNHGKGLLFGYSRSFNL